MRTIIFICLLSAIFRNAYAQEKGDILNSYHYGATIFRNDFDVDKEVWGDDHQLQYYSKNGVLTVFTVDSRRFRLPEGVKDYAVEVNCDMGSKSFPPISKSEFPRAKTKTIIFDAWRVNNNLKGVYLSFCAASNYHSDGDEFYYDKSYISIGNMEGDVFTEMKKIDIPDDDVNDFHNIKFMSVNGYYYFYYGKEFLCAILQSDANPDFDGKEGFRDLLFEENNGKSGTLGIKYYQVKQLLATQTKDIIPPTITLLTPVDDGNGIPEDDNGKILVSGRVTDTSGVAWVKLNGQDIGSIQANGYFSFNASSLSSNIIIQACDKAGNIGSKKFSFNIIRDSLVHIPVIPVDQPPVFHAVIIACSKYKDPAKNLPETITEANTLRSALTNYGFSDAHVHMLIDKTYDEIVSTLRNVMASMQANDNLLITFSGHGTYNQDKTNPVGYWITGTGMDYDHGYISSDQVKNMLSETDCKAKHILILSDACYSGAFKDAGLVHMSYSERTAYNYASTKVMTSCGFDKSPASSVFMADVIKALNDNATLYKKKYLSDIGMYAQIANAVVAGSGEEPNIFNFGEHGNQGGNFYFILKP